MHLHTLLAYTAVACVAILSPGPAIVLALRNGTAYGVRSVVWSALGNVTGLFCLSAASMLGLGVLLQSSALLFGALKIVGALYLFYMGAKQLLGRSSAFAKLDSATAKAAMPRAWHLYREAVLTAATNPKPILFFTALFPQFLDVQEPLLAQFFILTGIFGVLSFCTLIGYALLASRARALFARPSFAKWVNRSFGAIFIGFGATLLTLHRQNA